MSLENYQRELSNIQLVCDKLVTVQNSRVFDRLCLKCENLLNNIAQEHPESVSFEERQGIIAVLRGLLNISKTLSSYREYLVEAVRQNLALYEEQQRQVQVTNQPSLENNTKSSPLVLTKKIPNQNAA